MAARALAVKVRPGDYMTTAHTWDNAHLLKVLDGVDQT
jgi:hypothetical protein